MREPSLSDAQIVQGTYLELVQSVLSTLVPTIIMGLLFVLVAGVAVRAHPDPLLLGLACAGTITSVVRAVIVAVNRGKLHKAATVALARRFEIQFGAAYLTFAIMLGSFAARVMTICALDLQLLVSALVVGYAAGVAAGVALRPRISFVALAFSVLPLALASALHANVVHITLSLILIALLGGGLSSMLGRYRSTSEAIALRHLLGSLARRDSLTGLSNRLELAERFQELQASAESGLVALHCLDLDGFKLINDRFGHFVGDQVLQLVAERLSKLCTKGDVAARLGGDEFVFLQSNVTHSDEVELVRRRIMKVLTDPYVLEGRSVAAGVSVGSALAELRYSDLESLMKEADLASYQDKARGRLLLKCSSAAMHGV